MNIGLDIDGTITTLCTTIEVMNREFNKDYTLDDYTQYNLGEVYGLTNEEMIEFWMRYGTEIYERALPIWNLDEFVNKWSTYQAKKKKRNDIILVTARPESSRDITESWLKRNKVPYDLLRMGHHNKVQAVGEYFLDVMVDDKGEHIRDIDNETECETFLVDRPYNRWYETDRRIYVHDTHKELRKWM